MDAHVSHFKLALLLTFHTNLICASFYITKNYNKMRSHALNMGKRAIKKKSEKHASCDMLGFHWICSSRSI